MIIVTENHPGLAESVVCKNIITLGKKLEVGVHLIDPIELS
ncbi:hypothetical protein Sta7437_4914 (plasmid) [Stanieria cyanosphaera PCC 7437]|jgi:hypothetical protein|uniref:Uncharacterized protein n=1 Tax=Stanieria cyanosphaera (strain ATCC 29371 / PCC 7437) TaxID=111780 RepID=K9Y1Q6_STAC7|nr:hypothetical protein Sta7437_4914 [Stanieria cyanosphaera PCC 7437]